MGWLDNDRYRVFPDETSLRRSRVSLDKGLSLLLRQLNLLLEVLMLSIISCIHFDFSLDFNMIGSIDDIKSLFLSKKEALGS